MKEYICEAVPVYLRPQPITDEKACLGIVVRCPESGYAGYRVVDENDAAFERIARFFPRFGRDNLLRALQWSRSDIEYSLSGDAKDVADKFANLIRPRENVVQYGAPQIYVTTSPQDEAERLYDAFVEGVCRKNNSHCKRGGSCRADFTSKGYNIHNKQEGKQ